MAPTPFASPEYLHKHRFFIAPYSNILPTLASTFIASSTPRNYCDVNFCALEPPCRPRTYMCPRSPFAVFTIPSCVPSTNDVTSTTQTNTVIQRALNGKLESLLA